MAESEKGFNAMTSMIAGTAGHVDHGKTALIRALTGIDTDRLEEEKRRGISIDIGFAHLDLGPVRVAFVDVPGHERFVKNMLAGVGGIDAVLLVVAANESVRPQTREHFDICRLLGVRRGIVALTKSDLVESGHLELVRMEVEQLVAGSFLEGAPVVAVSSVTGSGLEELKQALRDLCSELPGRDTTGSFRLPVDRSFSLRGFGTVVTGTLIEGAISTGAEIEAQPGGRRLRVRGIETHGRAVGQAGAGERVALNVTGAEAALLRRGQVLLEPDRFETTREIACELHLLASARELKQGAPVHFHAGTAQTEARVRLVAPPEAVPPGAAASVRMRLASPLLVLPGDRFIIRQFSPVVTIGGGMVLDTAPPRLGRVAMAKRLDALRAADPIGRASIFLAAAPYGMSLRQLAARSGLPLAQAAHAGELFSISEPWLIGRDRLRALLEALETAVAAFHETLPLSPGMGVEPLRIQLAPKAPRGLLRALVERTETLQIEQEFVRQTGHRMTLSRDQAQAVERMEAAAENAGLQALPFEALAAASGLAPAPARQLIEMALRDGRLVRIAPELILGRMTLARLEKLVQSHAGENFSIAKFKTWTGVSRKYAVPLLEYLDRRKLTRRQGDERQVIARQPPIG
ncbi:MAG: selenocysteine-specific translation elongation factor [Bryobacterales bacterium]|nr:selenocysteine-specific translation elongation factor [Bryobacterales bacterium]